MPRELRFYQAIREALDLCLASDPTVYLIGLGVPDPKGIFGTTIGLAEKYGSERIMDMPTAENGMTGVALGSALVGMRPVMSHQRVDFALLAMEQIVNQAAKWHYMFGGKTSVPLVIRMLIGRGWGQGPQHSQSLHSWFAHIPGLKVVMPATPYDAKGLLISSIKDNNPVIFIEHRWLFNTFGKVPEETYQIPLGEARVAKLGKDVTILAYSYEVIEALQAADMLLRFGVQAEVIDIRTLRPIDLPTILNSVHKTNQLVVIDTGWKFAGFGAEIIASITDHAFNELKNPPKRLGLMDGPIPSSPALARYFYPNVTDIVSTVLDLLGIDKGRQPPMEQVPLSKTDVPDAHFSGPF